MAGSSMFWQFNLPTDPEHYPQFVSFAHREAWIRNELLNRHYDEVDLKVRAEILNETDGVWLNRRRLDAEQGGIATHKFHFRLCF